MRLLLTLVVLLSGVRRDDYLNTLKQMYYGN